MIAGMAGGRQVGLGILRRVNGGDFAGIPLRGGFGGRCGVIGRIPLH